MWLAGEIVKKENKTTEPRFCSVVLKDRTALWQDASRKNFNGADSDSRGPSSVGVKMWGE